MQGQHLLQHQLDHVPVLGSGRVEQEVVVLGISATALERKAIYVFRLEMSSLAHLRPILHKHLLGCKLSENHLVVDVVLLPDDDDGYPAYSHHDEVPPWWENVSNDEGGNVSVSKSHHTPYTMTNLILEYMYVTGNLCIIWQLRNEFSN